MAAPAPAIVTLPPNNLNYGGLSLPAVAPRNPPLSVHIAEAEILTHLARNEYMSGTIDVNAFSEIIKYRSRVLDPTPAWFAPAIAAALAPIQASLTNIQNDITAIRSDITAIRITQCKCENRSLSGTVDTPFLQVPFVDGCMPWNLHVAGPNNVQVVLLSLDTVVSVRGLQMHEAFGYFRGYYPGVCMPGGPNALTLRIDAIFVAIGRKDLHA